MKMTDTNQASEDEKLARLFHDTYERLAPAFSYKTRKASAVPWAEVPPNNKGLMIAVAHAVNALTRTEKLKLLASVRERVVGGRLDLRTFASDLEVKPDLETAVWVMGKDRHNELIDKQREALTELEAEL